MANKNNSKLNIKQKANKNVKITLETSKSIKNLIQKNPPQNPPEWQRILKHFRGNELQSYFTKILEDDLKTAVKPQYVDKIAKKMKCSVLKALTRGNARAATAERREEVIDLLELRALLARDVPDLSGGELQRLAIAIVCLQDADVYIFDEPSSYLDVRQRLSAAHVVRDLVRRERGRGAPYGVVVEHDLSVLDYLSDYVCVLYGSPGAYGVVTAPYSVREGINHFLDGFIPTENLRFRDFAMNFRFNDGDSGTVARGGLFIFLFLNFLRLL